MRPKPCLVKIKSDDWRMAELIGIFQYSNVVDPSPFIGGHSGGVIAFPVAVVRIGDELKEVSVASIKYNE